MAESVLNQEEQKTQSNKNNDNRNHIYKLVVITLAIIMIGLTVYIKIQQDNFNLVSSSNQMFVQAADTISSNYRSYVKQYKETKIQLEETTRKLEAVTAQLNEVTTQLETTKNLLIQTQGMLAEAQAENTKLKEDLQTLDGVKVEGQVQSNITELEARIATLKDKNVQASNELSDLKSQLKAFQADFSTISEGRSLITLFQNKIRLVKTRMNYLQQEAYFAKIAAQKEKDRIAMLNGNNGFLLQNGLAKKPGNAKSYSIDVKMVQ